MVTGEMRHNIKVVQKVITRDGYGAESITYQDRFQLKAAVKYNGGGKGVNNMEVFNSSTIMFEVYYRDITEDMQIIFDNRKYLINSIVPVGYRTSLIINAEKINE